MCISMYIHFFIPKKLSDVTRSPAQTGNVLGNVRNAIIIPIKLRFFNTFWTNEEGVKKFCNIFYGNYTLRRSYIC